MANAARDGNRVPTLLGVSTVDGVTPLAVKVDTQGRLQTTTTATLGNASTDFYPMYNRRDLGGAQLATDPSGALVTRGAITTDEGASRANFTGSALAFSPGSATFTNGSTAVTGTGFTTADLHYLDYIKLSSDSESAWAQVSFINSDTSITLVSAYTGTGGTGAYGVSPVATTTGTGATISVGSGQLTMALGTNTSATTTVYHAGSNGNLLFSASLSVSQRVANQDIYLALAPTTTSATCFSRFHFTGTTNTQVITETGWNPTTTPSASEQETNTITLPNGVTTASANIYRIEQQPEQIVFYVNNILVATHTKRIPHVLSEGNNLVVGHVQGVNSGVVTNTNVVVDYLMLRVYDRVDIGQTSAGIVPQTVTQNATQVNTVTMQNGATGTGNGTAISAVGYGVLAVQVVGITSATITWEATQDDTNWVAIFAYTRGGNAGLATSTTADGLFELDIAGYSQVRARISVYASGTITVTGKALPLGAPMPAVRAVVQSLSGGSTFQYITGPTDGASNGGTSLVTAGYGWVYNGTSWDRTREIVNATNSTGTGIAAAGLLAQLDDTSPTAITENQFGNLRMNADRALNVSLKPDTLGGHTTYHLVSGASTNAVSVKASAGQLYGWYIYNSNAAARKLAFHNTAGTPTAGAAVLFSIVVPPSAGANVFSDTGIAFSTGIGITTVTGLADSDATAVAANDLIINLFYK